MSKIKPIYGPTNPSPSEYSRMKVKRVAQIIGLKKDKEQYYRILHSGLHGLFIIYPRYIILHDTFLLILFYNILYCLLKVHGHLY